MKTLLSGISRVFMALMSKKAIQLFMLETAQRLALKTDFEWDDKIVDGFRKFYDEIGRGK